MGRGRSKPVSVHSKGLLRLQPAWVGGMPASPTCYPLAELWLAAVVQAVQQDELPASSASSLPAPVVSFNRPPLPPRPQVKLCLVVNKIDRLILELRLTPLVRGSRRAACTAHTTAGRASAVRGPALLGRSWAGTATTHAPFCNYLTGCTVGAATHPLPVSSCCLCGPRLIPLSCK